MHRRILILGSALVLLSSNGPSLILAEEAPPAAQAKGPTIVTRDGKPLETRTDEPEWFQHLDPQTGEVRFYRGSVEIVPPSGFSEEAFDKLPPAEQAKTLLNGDWIGPINTPEEAAALNKFKKELMELAESVLAPGAGNSIPAEQQNQAVEKHSRGLLKSLWDELFSSGSKNKRPSMSDELKLHILKVQTQYNKDLQDMKAEQSREEAQSQSALQPEQSCKSSLDLAKSAWKESRQKRTVWATQFGGPKDYAGGAPNISAYDFTQFVPAGHDRNLCECSLPGRLPPNTWLLLRKPGNPPGKPIYCKITDIGPMVTNDDYWKNAWDEPMHPARALDLTPACFDLLYPGVNIQKGKGRAQVEWQFTGAPPDFETKDQGPRHSNKDYHQDEIKAFRKKDPKFDPNFDGDKNDLGRPLNPRYSTRKITIDKDIIYKRTLLKELSFNAPGGWKWEGVDSLSRLGKMSPDRWPANYLPQKGVTAGPAKVSDPPPQVSPPAQTTNASKPAEQSQPVAPSTKPELNAVTPLKPEAPAQTNEKSGANVEPPAKKRRIDVLLERWRKRRSEKQ